MNPPAKKNPLARTRQALLPPHRRSRAATGLAAMAAQGRFALQVCGACRRVQYPPRDVCGGCLSTDMVWRDVARGGTVIAETTVRISADPYFRERTPWRIGMVTLDCGPAVVAHLHAAVGRGDRVKMTEKLDKAGQGVMLALPETDPPDLLDDKMIREMISDPRDRRILVTDARNAFGQAVAHAMVAAGARVFAGVADPWKPFPGQDTLAGPGVEKIELDVTDTQSVHRAVAAFGGRVEILVNTALHIRPGGIIGRGDVTTAREEMEIAYFGAMRLAQAFGPALKFRGADGTHPACAWVNILSVYALSANPAFGGLSASHAAALSLSHTLRAELRGGGIRVLNAFVGPLDDPWHQVLPPPKVSPAALANAIVRALRDGLEDIAVGEVAQDIFSRWRDDPAVLARELEAS
jgi:NAD(P)-dependent dehydrogenase (short-subunit alcohol dehydrogenase family)/uncharacterized OB-fold protein